MSESARRSCDYCPRFGVTVIYLRNGVLRALLKRPRRKRYVCPDHVTTAARPGGRHE